MASVGRDPTELKTLSRLISQNTEFQCHNQQAQVTSRNICLFSGIHLVKVSNCSISGFCKTYNLFLLAHNFQKSSSLLKRLPAAKQLRQ